MFATNYVILPLTARRVFVGEWRESELSFGKLA